MVKCHYVMTDDQVCWHIDALLVLTWLAARGLGTDQHHVLAALEA